MYPLTIGLAIENRDLMEQTRACLAELPFRVTVEHRDSNDPGGFLDRLERMRPDVVLVDISNCREPLEGLVSSIRAAAGDPMMIALNTVAESNTWWCLDEYVLLESDPDRAPRPRSAACASMSAAFPPRRCCMSPRSSPRRRKWAPLGVISANRKIDLDQVRAWKESVVAKPHRRPRRGWPSSARCKWYAARRNSPRPNSLAGANRRRRENRHLRSTPSSPPVPAGARIPGFPYDDPRIIDSTGALALPDVPKRMLIIGGGIIGLEMATVYDALGQRRSPWSN